MVFCAVFVVCVLERFFDLGFVLFAGCVFKCKNLEKNVRKCKKTEEKGKDRSLLYPEPVIDGFYVFFPAFWVASLSELIDCVL